MSVQITFACNQEEINAIDTAIKAYMNHPDDWYEGIDESPTMVGVFGRMHQAYLHAYATMRMTTPIIGDWIVLERYRDGKVMRGEFVQKNGVVDERWIQSVLNDDICCFERLSINDNDYAEWELKVKI